MSVCRTITFKPPATSGRRDVERLIETLPGFLISAPEIFHVPRHPLIGAVGVATAHHAENFAMRGDHPVMRGEAGKDRLAGGEEEQAQGLARHFERTIVRRARQHLVKVDVELDEPAYCYLIAYNTDGGEQPLLPDKTSGVAARGKTVSEAQQRAYQAVSLVQWPGGFCRRDIGWRAMARETARR